MDKKREKNTEKEAWITKNREEPVGTYGCTYYISYGDNFTATHMSKFTKWYMQFILCQLYRNKAVEKICL